MGKFIDFVEKEAKNIGAFFSGLVTFIKKEETIAEKYVTALLPLAEQAITDAKKAVMNAEVGNIEALIEAVQFLSDCIAFYNKLKSL